MTDHDKTCPSRSWILFPLQLFGGLSLLWWGGVLFSDYYLGSATDMVAYHIPFRKMVFEGVFKEGWPFWNPYLYSGTPLYSTGFQSPLHPLTWLSLPFSTAVEIKLTILICMIGSATGMFTLLRSRGCSPAAASFAGLWFAFGADWMSRAYAGHLSILMSFLHWPWFAWAVLRCFPPEAGFRRMAVAAGVFALALFSGNYNYLYLMLLWTIALSVGEADFRRWLVTWLKVGVLGMGLSAVHWVPLLFIMPQTSRSTGSLEFAVAGGAPLWSCWSWLSPCLFDGPVWWDFPSWEGHHYLGLIPLGLALVGMTKAFPERKRLGFCILVFGLLACGDSTPFYGWVFELDPLLHRFRGPSRFAVLVSLAFIWFAAKGLDTLRARRPSPGEGLLLAGPLVLALLLSVWLEAWVPGLPSPRTEELRWCLLAGLGVGLLGIVAVCLAERKGVLIALFCLCALDLRMMAQPWLRTGAEDQVSMPAGLVARMAEDAGSRVQLDPRLNWHNRGLPYGLSHPDGYERLVNSNYMDAVSSALGVDARTSTLLSTFSPGPFWELQGVRYAISPGEPPEDSMEEIERQDGLSLYRNPRAKDRAFLVYQVELGQEPAEVRAGLGSGTLTAFEQAIVDPKEFELALTHLGGQSEQPNGAILALALRNNWLWMRYRSNVPALLVVTDSPFPGWTARLGGEPLEIRQANGGLHRMLFVPAGEHELEMRYRPKGLIAGSVISLLCFVACLWGVRRRKARSALKAPTGTTQEEL